MKRPVIDWEERQVPIDGGVEWYADSGGDWRMTVRGTDRRMTCTVMAPGWTVSLQIDGDELAKSVCSHILMGVWLDRSGELDTFVEINDLSQKLWAAERRTSDLAEELEAGDALDADASLMAAHINTTARMHRYYKAKLTRQKGVIEGLETALKMAYEQLVEVGQ